MNKRSLVALSLLTVATATGCNIGPRRTPDQPAATPVERPAPKPVEPTYTETRADALVADMQRRQIEFAKFERENPYKEPSPAELLARLREGASSSPTPPMDAAGQPPQAANATTATADQTVIRSSLSQNIVAGDRDERYWKQRMREMQEGVDSTRLALTAAQAALRDLEAKYVAADGTMHRTVADNVFKQRNEVAQRTADFAAAQNRVNMLLEEARRENVPSGWLRP